MCFCPTLDSAYKRKLMKRLMKEKTFLVRFVSCKIDMHAELGFRCLSTPVPLTAKVLVERRSSVDHLQSSVYYDINGSSVVSIKLQSILMDGYFSDSSVKLGGVTSRVPVTME